jgi:type II secretion system protein G
MKNKGFTLLELLVVLAVIGVLASIVLVSLQSVRGKARDARRQADLRQMLTALELYYDDHLKYPEKGGLGLIEAIPTAIPPYLAPTPQDPGNIPMACQPEGYRWRGNTGQAQKYCAWACLENNEFFAVSPRGTRSLTSQPSTLDCW